MLFVLATGIYWKRLPAGLGGSGVTCWRRQQDLAAFVVSGAERGQPAAVRGRLL
jgi:hypothetical protein